MYYESEREPLALPLMLAPRCLPVTLRATRHTGNCLRVALDPALELDRKTDASWTNSLLLPRWSQPWCARMQMRLPGTVMVMSELLRHGFEGYLCR